MEPETYTDFNGAVWERRDDGLLTRRLYASVDPALPHMTASQFYGRNDTTIIDHASLISQRYNTPLIDIEESLRRLAQLVNDSFQSTPETIMPLDGGIEFTKLKKLEIW